MYLFHTFCYDLFHVLLLWLWTQWLDKSSEAFILCSHHWTLLLCDCLQILLFSRLPSGGWHEHVISSCDFYIDGVIFIFSPQLVLPAHDPIDKSCWRLLIACWQQSFSLLALCVLGSTAADTLCIKWCLLLFFWKQ